MLYSITYKDKRILLQKKLFLACYIVSRTVVAILTIHGTAMTYRRDEPLTISETHLDLYNEVLTLTISIASM
jgi:hypothetical protein